MKVLMLGWEYPPHISGGLGTACQGLTTALASKGIKIDFVVPRLFGQEDAPHMNLLDLWSCGSDGHLSTEANLPKNLKYLRVPAMLTPYLNESQFNELVKLFRRMRAKGRSGWLSLGELSPEEIEDLAKIFPGNLISLLTKEDINGQSFHHYSGDLFTEVAKYTKGVLNLALTREFDLVHVHDWMTYSAGVALSRLTGAPLVAHVHSLEYDRSGQHVNERIHQVESMGLHAANTIVAVSRYTKSVINKQHGIDPERIKVVYNGVNFAKQEKHVYHAAKEDKVVLFLGRITFQKGPDYFVEAAAKVIPHIPNVKFVLAGTGDMLPRMMYRVYELGLERNFEFPGFLSGPEVDEMFARADLYVMPSVSEPFGISALEALRHDVPVIISKQSGVSEVIRHALKVDFWDVQELANVIINSLKYSELRDDLLQGGRREVVKACWETAAQRTIDVYIDTLRSMLPAQQSATEEILTIEE